MPREGTTVHGAERVDGRVLGAILTGDFGCVEALKVDLQEARMRKDEFMLARMTHRARARLLALGCFFLALDRDPIM